jgi:hypothetical protein
MKEKGELTVTVGLNVIITERAIITGMMMKMNGPELPP